MFKPISSKAEKGQKKEKRDREGDTDLTKKSSFEK